MATSSFRFRDVIATFAPGQSLRAALLLTYTFDGRYFEQAVAPDLFDRAVDIALIVRDPRALIHEAPSVRYLRAEAAFSRRVFHPKLMLLVAQDRACAVIGSANLTRGGLERNLELGRVFELSLEGGPTTLFAELHRFLAEQLVREVRGESLRALKDVTRALGEVLAQALQETGEPQHRLLHNYQQPLWEQIINALPHRNLSRAVIISPFFEPDSSADQADDPPGEAADISAFTALLRDFHFAPPAGRKAIEVYFQPEAGTSQLPLKKLAAWANRIELFQRRAESTDARRLHGKFLVFEGASGQGRKPFCYVLHGSPNFTGAALLTTAQTGNSELAVLTCLPAHRGQVDGIARAMDLPSLFTPITNWNDLKPAEPRQPPAPLSIFFVADATLSLPSRQVTIEVVNWPAGGVSIRLLACLGGDWVMLDRVQWQDNPTVRMNASGLVDSRDTGALIQLRTSRIRIEVTGADGTILATGDAPLNVDCPEQFCGLTMTGPLLLTLDQRIAYAGAGTPLSYQEQQRWIEQLGQCGSEPGPSIATHQADLDRFYRNIRTGLYGLRRQLKDMPASEFTLRRTLRDTARWLTEATSPDSGIASDECRLFLVDRLISTMTNALSDAQGNPGRRARLPVIARELELVRNIDGVKGWLGQLSVQKVGEFVQRTQLAADALRLALDLGEAR